LFDWRRGWVGDEAAGFAVGAISRYFFGVVVF
jgi:hypothetical protein